MSDALRELMAQGLKEAEEKGGTQKKELPPIIIDLRKANADKDAIIQKYKDKYGDI